MTVEVRPLGVKCNIQCTYCYQDPIRRAQDAVPQYDLEAIKAAVDAEGSMFTIFGGEPLMVPLSDLENLWAWGFERFGQNAIQTNGTLIRPAHVEIFRKYNVHVGISVDGPDELNAARRAGSDVTTRRATAKTMRGIKMLCDAGLAPGIIVTLHRLNATAQRLPRMNAWLRELDEWGVRSVRLHALEVDAEIVRESLTLDPAELLFALDNFKALQPELKHINFDVFGDVGRLQKGSDAKTTCIWNACDPYTTRAVRGIEGSGQRSNCGRTNKDGVEFSKADTPGFERYIALYFTPQEHGGCGGCRFFVLCKGQCPGTAIDGDWRNRSEHCEIWKSLFTQAEAQEAAQGGEAISLQSTRELVESVFLECWRAGWTPRLADVLSQANHAPELSAAALSRRVAKYGGRIIEADHQRV